MKLEATHAELADEPARLPRSGLALGRINAGEGDQDVAVGGGFLGDLFIRIAAVAGFALGIDRKDHRADLALAIVGRGLFDGWAIVRLIEVDRHLRLEIIVPVIRMRAARFLGMSVNIDCDQLIDLHGPAPSLTRARRQEPRPASRSSAYDRRRLMS